MITTRIQSRIESVTVFREGAVVRRAAEIACGDEAAEHLCVTNLPLSLRDSSVRVCVEPVADADADALPVAADVRVILDAPEIDPALPPPVEGELETARLELRRLQGRITQAKRELARVERLIVAARPRPGADQREPPPASPTSPRLALLQLRESLEREQREQMTHLQEELRTAEKRVRQLQARHERASSARQAREHELRKALVIAWHAADGERKAARARLVVEYMVPGARWAPAYTVRLSERGEASLAMRAVVAQQSGEDWHAVPLTLSTADAQRWTELPELSSIRIGRRQAAAPKTGWRPPPSGVQDLFRDYDRGFRYPASPSSVPQFTQGEDDTRELSIPQHALPPVGSLAEGSVVGYVDMDDEEDSIFDDIDEATVPNLRPPPVAPMRSVVLADEAPEPEMARRGRPQRAKAMAKKKAKGAPRSRGSRAEFAASAPPPPGGMPGAFGGGGGSDGISATIPFRPQASAFDDDDATRISSLIASTELLAYGDLRMPAPGSDMRGSLQKVDARDIYMELLVSQQIEVSFNVLAVIAVASQEAESVTATPLPGRCRRTSSHDGYDYAYRADTPVDVPSDGSFHSIALTRKSADTEMSYVVVPRQTTDVFRVAKLRNPLMAPILPGPVDVYLGKDFLLTSDVSFTPPGGAIRLGLGVEQAVKVTRNTAYREESSGLLKGSLLLTHEIRIEAQNHLDRAITCEIRERIPSTRPGEDDIHVKVERAEPPWSKYDPKSAESADAGLEGGYHWQLRLDGNGGKSSVMAVYSIKIPSKYELAGGNRREA